MLAKLFIFQASRHSKQKKKLSRNQLIKLQHSHLQPNSSSSLHSSCSKYGFPIQAYIGRCLNRGVNHCKCTCMDSLYKRMGKLQRAISLIQRRESKIPAIKFLVLIHSACPYKNYAPKCSQFPHKLDYLIIYLNLFFFLLGV